MNSETCRFIFTLSMLLMPFILCTFSQANEADKKFYVSEYGAIADGKTEAGNAIRATITAAMNAGPGAEVILDEGTYMVKPVKPGECVFNINSAENLTIRGAGTDTRIIITEPTAGGFSVGSGHNVTLRDFTLDYDPAPFLQGIITAVNIDVGYFDLEVEEGFSTPDAANFMGAHEPYGKWGMIMDPAVRRIRSGTPDHYMTPRWEHVEGRVWRFFTAAEHYRLGLRHMVIGDSYVHLARGYGGTLYAQGCDNITFENITVHSSPGLVIGLVGNMGHITVRGLQVRFTPDTTRLLTANADGVHCQQNRSGPVIENCYFEGMADDGVNIYAPPNVLREVVSENQWLVSPNCQILPGDRLQVLEPKTGVIRGVVKAVDVKYERQAWLLTLEKGLGGVVTGSDHQSGDTLFNLDGCGAGFIIRNNHMNGNRRYGCLLRAGDGLVEGNVFEDTTGAGIVMTNEPDWPEGPVPWNITIRNNRFTRGGTCLGYADSPNGAALAVRATKLGHGLAEMEAIRGITIEKNMFIDRAGTAIYLGGVSGVTMQNNRINASVDVGLARSGGTIEIERCSDVAIRDTEIIDLRPGITAGVVLHPSVNPGEESVKIDNLNSELAPTSRVIDDRRD